MFRMTKPARPRLLRGLFALGLFFVLGTSGCRTVEYYERETLASPWMQFDEDPGEIHWRQKATYTREGAVGGVGAGAGGGCGCY